ncbi:hypothetical protein CMV_019651 [Castanea mollissima]|uniref:G domain-containing protein n=1 Tax=Castanea mollissima TaxID=60419 RepID=A0A8J4R2N5_9ROSI|nr:hypothetical protein CMV_019651 [Castanea mollissima]
MCGDDGVLSWFMYQKLLEFKLKEVISREPTLLVLVVGVPNVGKSSLINLIHQIVSSCFPVQENMKLHLARCLVSVKIFLDTRRLEGIRYDYKEKHEYNLKDLRPKRRKLPFDSDMFYIEYLLAVFNTQGTPLQWKHLNNRRLQGIQYDSKEKHEYNLKDFRPKRRKLPNDSDMLYIE